jgi:hypothetical protein
LEEIFYTKGLLLNRIEFTCPGKKGILVCEVLSIKSLLEKKKGLSHKAQNSFSKKDLSEIAAKVSPFL